MDEANTPARYEEMAELLKALAHPARLCIVHGLMEQENNVTTIRKCLDLPQSTVSQHLGILKSRGIIKGRRRGTEISYTVTSELARKLICLLVAEMPAGEGA